MKRLGLASLLLLCWSPALATTWYVHPAGIGDATKIQTAVDLAEPGDTVLVAPATYTDTVDVWIQGEQKTAAVHLTEEIVLLAEGDTSNTVISGADNDVAIFVEGVGPGGLIEGFRIRTTFAPYGCTAGAAPEEMTSPPPGLLVGIWCVDSGIAIRCNAIRSHGSAIELINSPVTVESNEISWTQLGITCVAGSDAAIMGNLVYRNGIAITVTNSAPSVVDNNVGAIGQMCSAIDCNAGGDAYIARNRFENIRPTAIIVGPAAPVIEENLFINGLTAIFMSSGGEVPVIRDNIFYDHGGWVMNIVGGNPVIENNTIDLGATRAMLLQGVNPIVRNNIVTRVPIGIHCIFGASPTFECNNFFQVPTKHLDDCPDQTGLNGNISVDPQFCGVWDSGNWEPQSDSPCAPGNHPDGYDCGRIGAKDVGCQLVPTRRISWGELKTLFQQKEEEP